MKKVVRLTERELVNLIKKVLKEESEPIEKLDLTDCLKSEFNLTSQDGLMGCVKISKGDTSIETLKLCATELAKKTNSEESQGIEKLELLTSCLTKKKKLTEEIDPVQTQREIDIKNNFCSVDEKGLIQFSGKFKGKKWEDFLCTMDIQPEEIKKFVASADTECVKGKVVNYFKGFEDIKKLTDEINRIKTTFPPPPGKEPRELRNEMLKGIKKFLDNKTVQFYSDFENKNKSFVGYIRKVEMNTPGKFELTINKYDPTTKKILDWGEGYVLNSKKPRIFEYHCCEYQNDDNCDDNLIPLEGTDTRGFTPQEMYLCNRAVENIMNEFCTQKKDEPKAPYFGQTQSTPSQLTEDTNTKKPRLYGPRTDSDFDYIKNWFCESDGTTIVHFKNAEEWATSNFVSKDEYDKIQKSCPNSPYSKKPNKGLDPVKLFQEYEDSGFWSKQIFDEKLNQYVLPGYERLGWTRAIVENSGVPKEIVEKLAKEFPDAPLSKIFFSGDYEGSDGSQPAPPPKDDKTNQPAPPPKDDKTNQPALTEDPEEELGAKVLVGKTAAFYDRKSKLGRGRIKDIEIMVEDGNKIFNKLKIVVTNIDGNNNEIPKGTNITNTKTILFDCNSDSMMIYRDENNRQYPPGYVYTNRELVKVLKNGYCANVKKAKLDYPGGPRFRR